MAIQKDHSYDHIISKDQTGIQTLYLLKQEPAITTFIYLF